MVPFAFKWSLWGSSSDFPPAAQLNSTAWPFLFPGFVVLWLTLGKLYALASVSSA